MRLPCFDTGTTCIHYHAMDAGGPDAGEKDERVAGPMTGFDAPPFVLSWPDEPAVPVILAVPHAGRCYPEALVKRMRQPEFSQVRLEDRHVDLLAREIAQATGAPLLIANAPRAMIDLNRAPEDMDWGMVVGDRAEDASLPRSGNSFVNRRSRGGLGLVPRRLPGLGEIWRVPMTSAELKVRIAQIHGPYHSALARALEALRDRWGAALLIDLHSMPPLRRRHTGEQVAEFVIGDRFGSSCDGMLPARAFRYLGLHERAAAHNRPYAGGYVLDRHAAPARGIHALQLEMCRSLYLDSRMEEPSARAGAVAKMLTGLVRELADEVAAMGRERQQPMAAE